MNELARVTDERASLPSLIDRASGRLMQARSSAEVLEAKAIAEMALHYARVTKAANESHADCLRIITRAEIRMANEIDAAQERGDLPRRGQHAAHAQGSGMSDVGIDTRRIAEWRDTRDAGEEVVEAAIQGALAEGRAPTKSDIRKQAKPGSAEKSEVDETVENFFTVADLALRVKNLNLSLIAPTDEMLRLVGDVVQTWSTLVWRKE